MSYIQYIFICMMISQFIQISNLTQSVANIEMQLRQQAEQRHRAETDLVAIRDLCAKLDQQKDTLIEQLEDKDTLKEHVKDLSISNFISISIKKNFFYAYQLHFSIAFFAF